MKVIVPSAVVIFIYILYMCVTATINHKFILFIYCYIEDFTSVRLLAVEKDGRSSDHLDMPWIDYFFDVPVLLGLTEFPLAVDFPDNELSERHEQSNNTNQRRHKHPFK